VAGIAGIFSLPGRRVARPQLRHDLVRGLGRLAPMSRSVVRKHFQSVSSRSVRGTEMVRGTNSEPQQWTQQSSSRQRFQPRDRRLPVVSRSRAHLILSSWRRGRACYGFWLISEYASCRSTCTATPVMCLPDGYHKSRPSGLLIL